VTDNQERWYNSTAFIRGAQILGIVEMVGGLALLLLKHDGAGGWSLLAVGAATFGGTGALNARRSRGSA
jgi:hypothetical protein